MAKKSILSLFVMTGLAIWGCSNSGTFVWGAEDTGPPPEVPTSSTNPFEPEIPGSSTGPYSDTFRQEGTSSMVDIVWVIDNSGSMGNNQQEISDNAELFTGKLTDPSVNADFRLMVVTTDPASENDLKNKCGDWITSSTAANFASCAKVGYWTNGGSIPGSSNREEGLEAARRALDPSYVNDRGVVEALNGGFLRDDADLQLVFVSDEEDQPDANLWNSNTWKGKSINGVAVTESQVDALRSDMATVSSYVDATGTTVIEDGIYNHLADDGHAADGQYAHFPLVANHVAFFQSLKSAERKVRAHAIVTTSLDGSNTCHKRDNGEEVGRRYKALAQLLTGTVTDICGTWSTTMDQLGLSVSGLEKCFVLKHVPSDRSSLEVTIGGAAVAAGDFWFESVGNMVCFETIPDSGSDIVVNYN